MKSILVGLMSAAMTVAVIGNAYFQKKQFYPSVVYLTKSNPSMAVIYIQAFVLVLMMGKIMRKVFFGQLRAAELEHLVERAWYAVTETCLAFTVFRDDFSPKFVALFTLLLFLKCFHWLAEDRVDYMERSPVISWLFHIRIVSLLLLLGSLDSLFVSHAYHSTIQKGPTVQLVFGFEYAILWTIIFNTFLKYVLHTVDLHRENPWENKAVYLLYSELIISLAKVLLYTVFMTIMIRIHAFPLFAIRPMYLSIRAMKKAVNDVIHSRRAIRNMNTLYPDATAEELRTMDNVCIICREEMTAGGGSKKLPCNHIFHAACLRSWFQRQQTCPTCRMDVLRTPAPPQPQAPQPPAAAPAPPPAPAPPAAAAAAAPWNLLPPLWPPMVPPAPPFPNNAGGAAAGHPTGDSAASSTTSNNNNSSTTPATGTAAQPTLPPFPFLPILFPAPPPPPSPELRSLSEDELRAMEGQERAHLEARIRCLRNIQTLLDAATLQMQQYSTLVAAVGNSLKPEASTSAGQDPQQEELRRLRLQKFATTTTTDNRTPPPPDNNN